MPPTLLSKRLHAILHCIHPHCECLADVGTDHGYIPIAAVQQEKCTTAIACDIVKGPLDTARRNIAAAGLSHRIDTRLADGLSAIRTGEADCIVISGMGGMMIQDIIHKSLSVAQAAKKLILQPQHDIPALRRYLHASGFEIIDEHIVPEIKKDYVILCASFSSQPLQQWTEQEYFIGKHLMDKPDPHLAQYAHKEIKRIQRYIHNIRDINDKKTAMMQLSWLDDVI